MFGFRFDITFFFLSVCFCLTFRSSVHTLPVSYIFAAASNDVALLCFVNHLYIVFLSYLAVWRRSGLVCNLSLGAKQQAC